jgi:hypothetical protein
MRSFSKSSCIAVLSFLFAQTLACSLNSPCPEISGFANIAFSPDGGQESTEALSTNPESPLTGSMRSTRLSSPVSYVLGTGGAASNGAVIKGGAGGKTVSGEAGKAGRRATGAGGKTGSGGSGSTAVKLDRFSFFVTSLSAIQALSKNQNGFGGDLRFGEKGPGAGLRGADKICSTIADRSMPGASSKVWRAFLSATADENGNQVNAIDRIGEGPWYDRLGRVLALSKTDLLNNRPDGADPAIANDFPNEDGVPNSQPDPTQATVDNHEILTGTNAFGELYSATATCMDWTTSDGAAENGRPRVGHSWPRYGLIDAMVQADVLGNWISALDTAGCARGVFITDRSVAALVLENSVGSGGGYGGFYCFALAP